MIPSQITIILLTLTCSLALDEGEECILQTNGQKGKCVSVHQCEDAKKLLQAYQRPQHCGFNRQTALVCCPIRQQAAQQQQYPGFKSDQMCRKYHDVTKQPLGVANGEKADAKEFPHMAALGYMDRLKNVLWLCGGSLISEQFVLTAAHCITSPSGPPTVVRLGDLNLNDTTEDADPQDKPVNQIIVHPLYKPPSVYHDIALIKLQSPVRFTLYVKPACLHVQKSVPVQVLQAIGFGKTDYFGESSSHLMKANLSIVSYEDCSKRYPSDGRRMKNGIIDDMHICAGDSAGRDTCPGDSGGPLHFSRIHKDPQIVPHFAIVGITSFGKACGIEETVGVYLRVSSYIQWIEGIVWS